jgi:hypothetical protein
MIYMTLVYRLSNAADQLLKFLFSIFNHFVDDLLVNNVKGVL